MADNDYDIGYGKPPKSGQFRKGQSGNPKGKTPGTKSVATLFHETTRQLINITENGEGRTVTKLEAIMLQLTTKALSGDLRAMKEILYWHRVFEQADAGGNPENPDKEKDTEVMRKLLARMNGSSTTYEPEVVNEETQDDSQNV